MDILTKLRQLELVRDTRGLSTVEYVIILALIAVVAISTWNAFGSEVNTYLEGSKSHIQNEMPSEAKGGGSKGGG